MANKNTVIGLATQLVAGTVWTAGRGTFASR
jgi:hypothetical protein